MGIVIIALPVVGANADAPAAVAVPAERLDRAALHGADGRAERAKDVVAEVRPRIAIAALRSEVRVMRPGIARRNGRERLEAVGRDPLRFAGLRVCPPDGKMPGQTAECRRRLRGNTKSSVPPCRAAAPAAYRRAVPAPPAACPPRSRPCRRAMPRPAPEYRSSQGAAPRPARPCPAPARCGAPAH